MKILIKEVMPNGTDIQIEDWSSDYLNSFVIGFYPVSKESIYREDKPYFTPYPKRGESFRCAFNFATLEDALIAFTTLIKGDKTFTDYLNNYSDNVVSKENFVKCVIS